MPLRIVVAPPPRSNSLPLKKSPPLHSDLLHSPPTCNLVTVLYFLNSDITSLHVFLCVCGPLTPIHLFEYLLNVPINVLYLSSISPVSLSSICCQSSIYLS